MNGTLNHVDTLGGGNYHQWHLAILFAKIDQSGKTMGARHVQIEQNHIKGNGLLAQGFQGGQGVRFVNGGISKAGLHRLFQGSAEKGMVISYQYCCHGPDLSMNKKKMLPFGRPKGQRVVGKNNKTTDSLQRKFS